MFPSVSTSPLLPENPCPGPETFMDWGLWQFTHPVEGMWDRCWTKLTCLDSSIQTVRKKKMDIPPTVAHFFVLFCFCLITSPGNCLGYEFSELFRGPWLVVTSPRTKFRSSPWDSRPLTDFYLSVIHPSSSCIWFASFLHLLISLYPMGLTEPQDLYNSYGIFQDQPRWCHLLLERLLWSHSKGI